MLRTIAGRVVGWTALVSLAGVLTTVEQPVLSADGPVKKAMAKRGRRLLPKYYDQVTTTAEQQAAIQKIQDEYDPKIEALQTQLKALQKERTEKIAAVLTPEQRKQIESAKAKDKERRKAAKVEPPKVELPKAEPSKAAEKTPATTPAEPKAEK